jgi:EAL domain-containing protein (putative c-di-GMP-specific phosphodiesterase class I)
MPNRSRRSELHRALTEHELVLHYQPVVSLSAPEVSGVEALVRWQHPVGGLLMPDDFLPAVAQTPTMERITRWVLHTACTEAARWPTWTVSVNVTARDLAQENFAIDVIDALELTGLACDRLVLELTETALVQDLPRAAAALGYLRDCGIGVALDDFGTGYSSMLYLRDLPVTSVKIDRAFISGLGAAGDDRAIVSSLLTLTRRVGLTAIAEGVETEAQARILRSMGCPFGQGYLWSRPLSGDTTEVVYRDGLPTRTGAPLTEQPPEQALDPEVAKRAHQLLSQGASLHTIAAALNAAGERNNRGHRWQAATVARLISTTTPAGSLLR